MCVYEYHGAASLLTVPKCHDTIVKLLPTLSMFLHDKAHRVRMAYLDLMESSVVANVPSAFDLDALLVRLVIDNNVVKRRIIKMLQPTFYPLDAKGGVLMRNVLTLMSRHGMAAYEFFAGLSTCVPAIALTQFVQFAVRLLVSLNQIGILQEEGMPFIKVTNYDLLTCLVRCVDVVFVQLPDRMKKNKGMERAINSLDDDLLCVCDVCR